jgi:hypothetical protein
MASARDTQRARLAELANAMIIDRSTKDIRNLLALLENAYDDMSAASRILVTTPHKGAYNPQDRNRVSEFCNLLVSFMSEYYGIDTPNYQIIPTNWETIKDPTSAQLQTYINSIITVRDKWCSELNIDATATKYAISQIYNGISATNANNIERVLQDIQQVLNDYIFSTIPPFCGQQTSTSAGGYVIRCGFNIWMGEDSQV